MSVEWYDNWYKAGGWDYNIEEEAQLLRRTVAERIGLPPGSKILDVGCGLGLHAHLLAQEGYEVVGIDTSPAAIAVAKRRYPDIAFHCLDASSAATLGVLFDVVLVRGMCWYHYELSGTNREGVPVLERTRELAACIRSGGHFVLQISTDFTGTEADSGVLNNPLDSYLDLFSQLGQIQYVCNWRGEDLVSQEHARRLKGNITLAVIPV
jgi:SAM-dependent methyltransferase